MKIGNWPLIYLEWDDAQGESENWEHFSEAEIKKEVLSLQKCVSVGFLLRETKDIVWIVPHIGLGDPEKSIDPQKFGGILIPKFSITKRVSLIDGAVLNEVKTSISSNIPLDNKDKIG